MKIKEYKTDIENFYIVISHKKDGSTNSSYILVNDNNNKAVEILPKYGPVTIFEQENVLDSYLANDIIDRGNWTQLGYNDNDFNTLLNVGNFEKIVELMKHWL